MITPNSRPLRVLWVDDDGPERFRFELYFLEHECKAAVDFAVTIDKAKAKLKNYEYDLMLLDNLLPAEDPLKESVDNGVEFLAEIRGGQLGREIGRPDINLMPIVMCSAIFTERLQRIQARYKIQTLQKPVDSRELKRIVDAIRLSET